jgi:hypothetical protein
MADLFQTPTDTIPSQQDRAIRTLAILYGESGENLTDLNITKYERSLITELEKQRVANNDRPFFHPIVAQATPLQPISSVAWNEAQKRLYIDLVSLYTSLTESSGADVYVGELSREKFLQTKAGILKIINEVRLYQFLKAYPDYQDAKFVNFHSALNETEKTPVAAVDLDVRLLELAPRVSVNQSRERFDLRSTEVEIETLGAVAAGFHQDFAPRRMLDANPESFWADLAMADGPILQDYSPSGDGGLGNKVVADGVLVHVYLTMSSAAVANNIKLLPFGEFPVQVIDLAYKESTAQDQWQMIPGFQVEDATLDWIEVNFDPKTIASIRVTLLQRNYRLSTYHLPEHLVRNALLWQQIGQEAADNSIIQVPLSNAQTNQLTLHPSDIATLQVVDDFNQALQSETLSPARERQFDMNSKLVRAATDSLAKIRPDMADDVLFPALGEKVSKVNKVVTIHKYEYIYGLRSVEVNNIRYEPLGHYSTQRFAPDSTVLEVSLTTEERHPTLSDGIGTFYKTSTEWEIELSKDRKFAIAPKNWEVEGEIIVPDEYLQFDRVSRTAITRLPISDKATVLRRNGERVDLSKYSISTLVVEDPYTISSVEPANRVRNATPVCTQVGRGVVTITDPAAFDSGAVYTLQYVAQSGAEIITVDGTLNSTALLEPEVFQSTNREHAIVLSRVPYIDYGIVNSDRWVRDDLLDAKWKFNPTKANYKTGTVSLTAVDVVTGLDTLWLTGLDTSKTNAFRKVGDPSFYKISQVNSDTGLTLAEIYKGVTGNGLEYMVGEYFESDGIMYAFENSVYEPIRIYVNDVKAYNLTDYDSLEHPAFTEKPQSGKQYQYIQAGNIIYFNAPIENAKIEVYYSWLTEYIKVNSVLRCNIPVATFLTPQVNSLRVEMKTSKL